MVGRYSRIMVTGGAGFIGSHIVDRLVKDGCEVTVIDDLSYGHLENIVYNQNKKEVHFMKGDIRDYNFVAKMMKGIDAVFHEAALASVGLSIQMPFLTNDINITGTLNVLRAAADQGVRKFVNASSAAVYGDVEVPKVKEGDATDPASPYGVSKLAAEKYARYFFKLYGLETVSLRYFNAFGPRQNLDAQSPYSGVTSIFLEGLLGNKPLTIYGDGKQTRDFVFVEDIVAANMLALNCKNVTGEVFNVGSGIGISINKVAETLKKILDKGNLGSKYVQARSGDIRHSCADLSKAESILGYTPKFSFEGGAEKLVNWYVERYTTSVHKQ